jgi:O-antigen/teichoic acid export membrane protein
VLPVLHLLARRPGIVVAGTPLAARAVLTAGLATLAMLVVSYADLLLARRFLPVDASGAYAVGTVLTKGALWAPQVVTLIALPRLAQDDRRTLRIALTLVGACGVVLVAGAWVAGGLAFRLAGGTGYVEMGRYAPVFAATGAVYGVLFVLINAQVAAGVKWPAAPLWTAAAVFVLTAWLVLPHTVSGIAFGALGTAVGALVATAVLVGLRMRAPVTAPRPEYETLSVD